MIMLTLFRSIPYRYTVLGLADAEAVSRQTGITIIPGMEWTTFHGNPFVMFLMDLEGFL